MINKLLNGFKYIADFYRTAPVSETFIIFNMAELPFTYDDPLYLTINLLSVVVGGALTAHQFRLKSRLEKLVKKYGYDERIFSVAKNNWCDRKTAEVIAKKYGCLDKCLEYFYSKPC